MGWGMSLFKNTAIIFSTMLLLIGCGGGSGGSSNGVTPSYTIGGTVSGLSSSKTVVLQNNAGDNLTVSANGSFTFATSVASGAAYAVTVLTQPSGMTCTVSNGTGTASSNVSNVGVSCQPVVAFVFASISGGNGQVYSAPIDSNGALGQAGLATSTGTTTLYTSVASPNGKFLYLSSIADGGLDHLRGFAIDSNNAALTAINAIPNSADPVYGLAIHPSGNYLYASGSTSNYSNDFVQAYQVNNQTGGLTPIGQQLAGAGQYNRAVAITPSGNLVFTIAEVNGLLTAYITSYGVGNDGALTRIGQPLAVTDGVTHICPHDVVVDSTGSYAYFVSYQSAYNNWGCINAIYGFRINADGSLSAIGSTQFASGGTDSSKLTASPTAGFIYLPDSLSGNIYAFRINAATGALTPVGSQPTNVLGGPVDVAIDATGRHAYVSTNDSNSIITFSIDQTTGALTNPRTTSLPPPAGGGLYAITVAPKQ